MCFLMRLGLLSLRLVALGALGVSLSACVTAPSNEAAHNNSLLSRATPEMAQAVQANPQSSDAWFQLGNSFAENDQLLEAEKAYQQALLYGPHVKAQHNLGLVHIRLGMEALRSASAQLPADSPTREQTRQFLELMREVGY
jgi:cytochrome c-type biogenesis protein CcmH/NrfG